MAQGNPYSTESTNSVTDLQDRMADQIHRISDKVEVAAKTVADRGRDAGENVQQVAGNFKSAVDSSLRDQPMATLAMAAAVGFILGALWRS